MHSTDLVFNHQHNNNNTVLCMMVKTSTWNTAEVERNRVERFPKTKEEDAKPDMMPKTAALLPSETLSACNYTIKHNITYIYIYIRWWELKYELWIMKRSIINYHICKSKELHASFSDHCNHGFQNIISVEVICWPAVRQYHCMCTYIICLKLNISKLIN